LKFHTCFADKRAKAYSQDVIVGLGGGNSLDISKVTSVLLSNEGAIEKYFGMELVSRPGVPLIPIPTTAGTGSSSVKFTLYGPDALIALAGGIVESRHHPPACVSLRAAVDGSAEDGKQ
jgi:alcohol dehydrogenase